MKTCNLVVDRPVLGVAVLLMLAAAFSSACNSSSVDAAGIPTESIYNKQTGRLEQLKADADADGRQEITAFMDGTRLTKIEIDRNNDGKADRWEYYEPGRGGSSPVANGFDRLAVIARAEEASGPDATITRREFYKDGRVERVEEDTNVDGRIDKWEFYESDGLARVDLDVEGKGFADHRLVYGPDGGVSSVQLDPDGDGRFTPQASSTP